MKKAIFLLSFCLTLISFGQTNLSLKIRHLWKNAHFSYGQQYTDQNDNVLDLGRVQYYLSNFYIVHDGGQVTPLDSVFVLASGNISTYALDTVLGITTIDSIGFDLGIDSNWNHLDPNLYDSSHPLAPQVPTMHWGWTGGYNFLVLEGNIDTDGNGSLDGFFEFHCVGDDSFIRHIEPIAPNIIQNGNDVTIEVMCNISDWVVMVDLPTALANHGAMPINAQIMDNTLDYNVFKWTNKYASIDEKNLVQNMIQFDYSMPYAPSIFYNFPKASSVDLWILDINGSKVIESNNLDNEGNFFIKKELKTGVYFANFRTSDGTPYTKKFVIRN
ncbi:MAG: MbnP family protein [Crocinitomicaceae bacterium]